MIFSRTCARTRLGGLAALAGAALALAGCGSSGTTSSTSAAAPASSAADSGASVALTKGAPGSYLTGASGRALYLFDADSAGKSTCSGACAKVWPPLLSKGNPVAGHGITASDLSTITRSDGAKQVTYHGHPLYYYVSDTSAGATTGQGSESFGAKWWLVAASGSALTSSGSGGSSTGSSGGGSVY